MSSVFLIFGTAAEQSIIFAPLKDPVCGHFGKMKYCRYCNKKLNMCKVDSRRYVV